MTLTPGTRLGVYEITALLGAGGMGEVYRATDTNLKRSVAIKVLPKAVATDAARLARFQREAEVLAALNHPHIAQIYGVEDGALVMELVNGPTLADRIAMGAMPRAFPGFGRAEKSRCPPSRRSGPTTAVRSSSPGGRKARQESSSSFAPSLR